MHGESLLVFTDYVSPACYLAEPVLDALQQTGIGIERRPFELFPAPLPLPDFGSAGEAEAWSAAIEPLAARYGMAIRRPRRAVRTRKAHEAALFARAQGAGEELHRAIFAAYFGAGLDIARVDVLVRLGEGVGLPRSELKVVLDLDSFAADVAAARDAALRAGITAAPAFVSGDGARSRALVGYHDEAAVRAWLRDGRRVDGPDHEQEAGNGGL